MAQFIEGFRIFDRDGSGMVSAAEIRHLLTSLGEALNETQVTSKFLIWKWSTEIFLFGILIAGPILYWVMKF